MASAEDTSVQRLHLQPNACSRRLSTNDAAPGAWACAAQDGQRCRRILSSCTWHHTGYRLWQERCSACHAAALLPLHARLSTHGRPQIAVVKLLLLYKVQPRARLTSARRDAIATMRTCFAAPRGQHLRPAPICAGCPTCIQIMCP